MKAEEILPMEVIELIQKYVDGENIYIPRKADCRQEWGTTTGIKKELNIRNKKIYKDFCNGAKISELADSYCLSEKSIQRIIHKMKE
ncbi:MAG: hypothetical protein HDT39_17075 [Lachnospiraceae bacterium]|nr:hypothetical protein [Lachnospiraceae bacterium]